MFYFQFKELCWLLNSFEAEIQEFFTIPLGLSIIYATALELLLHFSFSLALSLSAFKGLFLMSLSTHICMHKVESICCNLIERASNMNNRWIQKQIKHCANNNATIYFIDDNFYLKHSLFLCIPNQQHQQHRHRHQLQMQQLQQQIRHQLCHWLCCYCVHRWPKVPKQSEHTKKPNYSTRVGHSRQVVALLNTLR